MTGAPYVHIELSDLIFKRPKLLPDPPSFIYQEIKKEIQIQKSKYWYFLPDKHTEPIVLSLTVENYRQWSDLLINLWQSLFNVYIQACAMQS